MGVNVGVAVGGRGLAVSVGVGVTVAVADGRGVSVGVGVALGNRPNPAAAWQDDSKKESKIRKIINNFTRSIDFPTR